jgi:hypothetical protein
MNGGIGVAIPFFDDEAENCGDRNRDDPFEDQRVVSRCARV